MSNLQRGLGAYENLEFDIAFQLLMPFAQSGNIQAQRIIAYMYDFGEGRKADPTEAVKWYRLAAEQGDPIARNNLASLILSEQPDEAIALYSLAAEQGFPFAQEALGDIYSGQFGLSGAVKQHINALEAIKWYKRAAQQGATLAAHRLGEIYSSGQEVNQDLEEAIFWYTKAANDNYKPSQQALENLLEFNT